MLQSGYSKFVLNAAEAYRGSLSPFVVTADGALGPEAVLFLWYLVEKLSVKWERDYGEILVWIKARLSFAVIRAILICVCGDHMCNGDLAWVLMMELTSLHAMTVLH